MKYYAVHTSRTQLKVALQELLKVAIANGVPKEAIPKGVQLALDYADTVDDKLASYEANWMEEFMNFFNSDDFSEQSSVEECKSLFLMSLKGSSDITYNLLSRLGVEYQVDIDKVVAEQKH
jgi:hypothetical protein